MSEWRGDELSAAEKKAFGALARQREPRRELEEHVVAELRRKKVLWRKRVSLWIPLATLATSVAIVFVVLRELRRPSSAQVQPRWVLLLREGHEDRSVPAEESRRRVSEYATWAKANAARGLIDGEKLGEEGVVFSGTKGRTAVRTPESVAGYFLLGDVGAEQARAIALSCPHLAYGGEIELRLIETSASHGGRELRGLGYVDPPYVDAEDDH